MNGRGTRMMSQGTGLRLASMDRSKQRLRKRWGDLGSPTEPCVLEYQGEHPLKVREAFLFLHRSPATNVPGRFNDGHVRFNHYAAVDSALREHIGNARVFLVQWDVSEVGFGVEAVRNQHSSDEPFRTAAAGKEPHGAFRAFPPMSRFQAAPRN